MLDITPPEVSHAPAAIAFEVRSGNRRVQCTISAEALEAASSLPPCATEGMRRRSFDRFRTLIDATARQRLASLPPGAPPILLTSQDLRLMPHIHGEPVFATVPRREEKQRQV